MDRTKFNDNSSNLDNEREPLKGEKTKELGGSSTEKFDRNDGKDEKNGFQEITDEERKHRNFLGLKLKGPIKKDELENCTKKGLAIILIISSLRCHHRKERHQ